MVKFCNSLGINSIAMTTKEERLSFLEEMKDVRRIKKPNRAEVQTPRELTPGHLERQRAGSTPVWTLA